ncbi:hypothetical protein LTR16_002435 [Cryomyces antarcticus]|uniref:Plastocyanin-like domain-containing protein n=1 Tax=Cryomyces antarcticus TaxID=329879 RepID=A0ABR0MA04_9PEZI|nr:hypothetical protein LTR16_002435 [Cryomyces antarcticus]
MTPNSLALGLYTLLWSGSSNAALRSYNFTIHQRSKAPDGVSRDVYLINGQQPGPQIEVDEGDDVEVFVKNELPVKTTIHWHARDTRDGRRSWSFACWCHISPKAWGATYCVSLLISDLQLPIAPGGNFTYKFSVDNEYGFYWYHSHFRAYYNDAVRGALMIHPAPSRIRPFERLASSGAEKSALLQAERNATSVLLNDWTHSVSDTIHAQYFETGAYPFCVDSLLANGLGRVQCLPESILQAGMGLGLSSPLEGITNTSVASSLMTIATMAKRVSTGDTVIVDNTAQATTVMNTSMASISVGASSSAETTPSSMMPVSAISMASMISSSAMSIMSVMSDTSSSMAPLSPRGCTPPTMFRPGFNASSMAPKDCVNTTSPVLTIKSDYTQGWLALNLVNSGAVSQLGSVQFADRNPCLDRVVWH